MIWGSKTNVAASDNDEESARRLRSQPRKPRPPPIAAVELAPLHHANQAAA